MKKLSLLFLTLISLSGCASQASKIATLGEVVSCDSIVRSTQSVGVQLPCLDGKSTLALDSLQGPLIVNVWGSWCASCKDEIPIFRSFYSKAQSRLAILGIDVEEAKLSDGSDFVVQNGMTWPNVIDLAGKTRGDFGMGVPVTWFIDAKGVVVYKKIGVIKSERQLRDLTSKYLHITIN